MEEQLVNCLSKDFFENIHEERLRLVELVRRWAGATTDAILDPSMQIFYSPGIHGCVAYRVECNSVIVFGDPTSSIEDRDALTLAFHNFIAHKYKNLIYISASQSFAHWAMDNGCQSFVEFGKELILDPLCDPAKKTGVHGSLVRRKLRSAARAQVSVYEYFPRDLELENSLIELGKEWLRGRRGLQIHISNIYLFNDCLGKRWIYAKQGARVVGSLSLNELQQHRGWLLNHLMTSTDAPVGTSELLVTSALEILKKEGCRYVTVGVVTPKELGSMVGLTRLSQWVGRLLFKIARKAAHLDGLNTFWRKFSPQEKPAYLVFKQKKIGIQALIGLRKALGKNSKGEKCE